jgi:hypothetical protein
MQKHPPVGDGQLDKNIGRGNLNRGFFGTSLVLQFRQELVLLQ